MDIEQKFIQHEHNGKDSQKVKGRNIAKAPQPALTASLGLSAGGTYTSTEQNIINNLVARVDELESRLQTLGFLN